MFEDEGCVYMVMELLRGGELFDKIQEERFFSEKDAAAILYIVASTINYLHANGVSGFLLHVNGQNYDLMLE